MLVVMASSEVAPLARTGGLGDVLGALPQALRRLGIEVVVVLPYYREVRHSQRPAESTGWTLEVPLSSWTARAAVWRLQLDDGTPVYAIENDHYFDRPGLYGPTGGAYPDNAERFAFFSRAVLALLERLDVPDIVHCHDWPTGLVPAFLRADPGRYPSLAGLRSVFTIHNLGYQGDFWHLDWHLLNLDWRYFSFDALEAWGRINYLKAGIAFADAITTVSPTYAREIQTPQLGNGLDGILRYRAAALRGILNGIDDREWDPSGDPNLVATYGADDLAGKRRCKTDLQQRLGLPVDDALPVFGVVSRLAEQKGLDLLAAVTPRLMQRDAQLVVLGSGDAQYEQWLRNLAHDLPLQVAAHIGFNDALAHQIEAGSDLFLMPSRYEPCGLNQMYSLRYGTIPVVRATGGLEDSVIDADAAPQSGNGFKFVDYSADAFWGAIERALLCYGEPPRWQALVQRAMRGDFSWARSATAYLEVYRSVVAGSV